MPWGPGPPRKNRDFPVELGETTHPVHKKRPVKKSPGLGRPTPAVNSLTPIHIIQPASRSSLRETTLFHEIAADFGARSRTICRPNRRRRPPAVGRMHA